MMMCEGSSGTARRDVMWRSGLLLVLVLCVSQCLAFDCATTPYTKQVPEFTVCPNGAKTEKSSHSASSSRNVCEYIVDDIPFINCKSVDPGNPFAFCWRVRDSSVGSVEVVFPLLPQGCNYTGYDVTLQVYEATDCSAPGIYFTKHSMKEVKIKNCHKESCMDHCSQKASLVFNHVFSACYQLFMVPKRHYQGYQELMSVPTVLTTHYHKTPLSAIAKPYMNLNWNPSGLTLQAKFPMNPAGSCITLSHGINMSLGSEACRRTGIPLSTCFACLGSPEIQCRGEREDQIIPTCSHQVNSVVRCEFLGLKPGNYCVRVQFEDDRCVSDTIWDENENYSKCIWEIFDEYLPSVTERPPAEVYERTTFGDVFFTIVMIFLIMLVIVACIIVAWILYHHQVPSYPQFLPVHQHRSPVQTPDTPIVLLLYARDCPLFMQAVVHFRNVVKNVLQCEVKDCWDESQYEDVVENQSRWLLSLLNNPRVRTVLLTSPASVLQEFALIHNAKVMYKEPQAFDKVLTHALNTLHGSVDPESYKKVFIVRLDTGEEGSSPKARTLLNPLVTYVLPVHLNRLLTTLCNLDGSLSIIPPDGQPDVAALTDTIAQYRQYLKEHPRYLDSLMISDADSTVHHIVA